MTRRVTMTALPGIPLVAPGDDLAGLILDAVARAGDRLETGDVLVVAQKIVSKAEDRYVDLRTVTPGAHATALAAQTGKDPRMVEVILGESTEVVRFRPGVIVVAHRLGFVSANAGIDHSNIEQVGADERVLLLPREPDASARRLSDALAERTGARVGVIVNDSHGRAWRNGTVGVAIGSYGVEPLTDLRGQPDLFGRALQVTTVGQADEIAAAGSLVMGQAAEATPVVLVRGLAFAASDLPASVLVRPKEQDLFR
ncbi:MAG: coenzyme F420-0:L-glutamate ligase [Alphaproteobacteria bacterium]